MVKLSGENKLYAKIEIDKKLCKPCCKVCVDACPLDVLRWDENTKEAVVAYPEDCVWCCICEIECPVQCINVIPNLPMRIFPSCVEGG